MTMRTSHKVKCECGHEGIIRHSESDQPYAKCWDSYSLEGLEGSGFYTEKAVEWDVIFKEMKPKCPQCQKILSSNSLVSR